MPRGQRIGFKMGYSTRVYLVILDWNHHLQRKVIGQQQFWKKRSKSWVVISTKEKKYSYIQTIQASILRHGRCHGKKIL